MQAESFRLRRLRVGSLPILDQFIERMGLRTELLRALSHRGTVDALVVLLKNILVDRDALYAIEEWGEQFDPYLVAGGKIGDDRIGRALDRLFEADRATLQTRIVLSMVQAFQVRMDRIHNDTTSVTVHGEYAVQKSKAVQLRRGYNKDHRPDLKQLVYSLCVSSDGAVPVHFKAYDGNRTDDGIQLETWLTLRSLLGHPRFVYVGDSKLCVEETMLKIDRDHGRFVTMVPKTRAEVAEFTEEVLAGEVRWDRILRKRSNRKKSELDTFDCAVGLYQLREGFRVYWYRSSQKKKRDAQDRRDRIARAREILENLSLQKGRGPKTERALQRRVDTILSRLKVQNWLQVEIKMDVVERFRALTRGKPTEETRYRRLTRNVPRLLIRTQAEAIARSKAMDGIFPLATNTMEKSVDVLRIYKYQPRLEKRHAFLKSTLEVTPVWIKNNTRIEALMFIEYLAQIVAALIERELRTAMKKKKISRLHSLPEGRASKTPTFDQILRLFEHCQRHELYEDETRLKSFVDPLSPVQVQILELLRVPRTMYRPASS